MKLCFSIKLCNGFICICLLYLVESVSINHVKLHVDLYDKEPVRNQPSNSYQRF